MKKKVTLIIEIIVFILALCGLTCAYYFSNNTEEVEEEPASVGITEVNNDNFKEEVLDSKKPVILEFSSKSCPPCVAMLTTLIDIAKNNKDIKVVTVDIDDKNSTKIAEDYEISATPTIMVFDVGEAKGTLVGAVNEDKIMDLLRK